MLLLDKIRTWPAVVLVIAIGAFANIASATDCNSNGIPDHEDIAQGFSRDVDINDVPDECQPDCNNNDVPDGMDIAGGTSSDCNSNGVPDECDIGRLLSRDTNANGVPDECEDAAPALTNALSQKRHGTGLSAVTRSIVHGGVECRSGGITTVTFFFDKRAKATDGTELSASDFILSRGTVTNMSAAWLAQSPYNGSVKLTISGVDTPGPFRIAFAAENTIGVEDQYEVCWTYVPGDVDGDGDADGADEDQIIVVHQLPRGSVDKTRFDLDLDNVLECQQNTGDDWAVWSSVAPISHQILCDESDCNTNGIPDDLDIANGTCSDANMDGIPDECAFTVAPVVVRVTSRNIHADGQVVDEVIFDWFAGDTIPITTPIPNGNSQLIVEHDVGPSVVIYGDNAVTTPTNVISVDHGWGIGSIQPIDDPNAVDIGAAMTRTFKAPCIEVILWRIWPDITDFRTWTCPGKCQTCGSSYGQCHKSFPCCGDPDPCCNVNDPCCGDPDRCCRWDDPCCHSPDPCCNANDPCCGNPDRCCNEDNPCCGNPDPCCNPNDPCCGNPDPCCNPDNPCCNNPDRCCDPGDPCCASPDPCCNADDPCCGDPDRCCNPDNPCCGSSDPCCNSNDPCCGDPDPCCNPDNPCCNVPPCPECQHCDGGACTPDPDCASCTGGWCIGGACVSETCGLSVDSGIGCPGSTVELELTASCSPECSSLSLAVSQMPSNATVIILGGSVPCDGADHVRTVQVQIDQDAPRGPQNFTVTGTMPKGGTCNTGGSVEVPGVTSMDWTEYSPNSTPLDACPNNWSLRIFPGARYGSDPFLNIRRKVSLEAQITPAVEGCTVQFRSWDVDDPFDQQWPAMANVAAIDSDRSGPDNRLAGGSDPGVGTWEAVTDSNGRARVDVEVSIQPGNNYRAGASTVIGEVSIVTQAEADANNPPAEVVFSDMLTVWRHVWLELDSMGAGSDTSLTGNIDAIINNSPHTGDGTVELNVSDINDDGRFEGGIMTVAGTTYSILDNVDATGDDYYTMSGLISANHLGLSANVVDDDTAVLPSTPDANINILDSKYRHAYIEFAENSGSRSMNNTFIASLPFTTSAISAAALQNAWFTPNEDRWVAIVLTCYQSHDGWGYTTESTVDADPDRHYHIHGASFSVGDGAVYLGMAPLSGANVTGIYRESILDYIAQVGMGMWPGTTPCTISFLEPRVIAHEIGHMFGLEHPAVGAPSSLMSGWDGTDKDFSASELAEIRSSVELASH